MKFPLFASFIVFIIWLTYELHKHSRIDESYDQAFWDREALANATRKKSLDALSYITIPLEQLPMELCTEEEEIQDIHKTLLRLSKATIVNLTGFTNTELKLQYGAPNINRLTEYDQNYTLLVRTLQKWASYLYQKNYLVEAKAILEFAVSTKTDVSSSYKLLADIYLAEGSFEKISDLISIASTLNSAMKNTIVHTLQEFDLCSDSLHSS
ncbi:MAG: hypothetical protein RRX92_03980 [Lachnospiraceae bacterium]